MTWFQNDRDLSPVEQAEWEEVSSRMAADAADERQRRNMAAEVAPWAEDPPCLDTSVSRMISAAIERCITSRQNGIITGVPGAGKTKALLEVERRGNALEGPEAVYLKITGVIGSSTMAIYDDLAPHLGIKPATSIAATQKRMMRHAYFRPLILFDEAQNMGYKQVRDLLEISNDAQIPMLFCGNDEVLQFVNSTKAAIQQIARRLPVRMEIRGITDDDADLIASWFGCEGMDTFRACRVIGHGFHADGIATVLKEAKRLSPGQKTIRLPAVQAALEMLPQMKRLSGSAGLPARRETTIAKLAGRAAR